MCPVDLYQPPLELLASDHLSCVCEQKKASNTSTLCKKAEREMYVYYTRSDGGKMQRCTTRGDGKTQKERLERYIYIQPGVMEEKGRERCTYYTRKELEKERVRVYV